MDPDDGGGGGQRDPRPPLKSQVATCLHYTLRKKCGKVNWLSWHHRSCWLRRKEANQANKAFCFSPFINRMLYMECFTPGLGWRETECFTQNYLHRMLYTWAIIERNRMLYMECFTRNALHLGYDGEKQNALHGMLYTECFTPGLGWRETECFT